ncbi:MAG: RNA polymerase factor sigma-54 [Bacteroidota bacterium]
MLNQSLQQKLLQKLSPQQILLMKLLQIPSMALEQRIKQEIEENPVLEIDEEYDGKEDDNSDEYDDTPQEKNEDSQNDVDIHDYLDDDDVPSYRLNAGNTSASDEHRDMPMVADTGFIELLLSQLEIKNLPAQKLTIGKTIIGNLDEAGYLQRDLTAMVDDLAFTQGVSSNLEEIEQMLRVVQGFEPAGVGARTLQECLILQLKRLDISPSVKLAITILDRCFEDFSKKHYDKIMKRTHSDEEELRNAISEILKLNPKPGSAFSPSTAGNQYVIPDFIIEIKDGILELSLNQRNMPELRLSRTYTEMLETYGENKNRKEKNDSQRDAVIFIKQKIDSARWFIEAIKQRQDTLYLTMKAIMDYQQKYFLEGDETRLRPMILKDIAEIVNLDISTISRVANSKYVQTPYGTFLLKSFFSESLQNDQGEEVSTREIKKILSDCIAAEDKSKPLTDEELTAILKQKGYPIARRTVAKYRELLNIAVARLRKVM